MPIGWSAADGLYLAHVVAGIAIVREAGGIVTEVGGGPDSMTSGDVLAANGHLHGVLRQELAAECG